LFVRSIANRIVSVDPNNGTVTREFDIPQPSGTPLRPYAEIDYKTSGGHDAYDAMQLSVVKRASAGLTLNAQYSLGHSRGTSAGSNEAITVGNNARNIEDFDYDQGDNNFDIRHNFNASAVYTIPFGHGRTFGNSTGTLINAFLGGWNVSAIANARSGIPINVLIGRPDVVFVDSAGLVYTGSGAGRTAVINTPGGGSSRSTRRPNLILGVDPYLNNDRSLLNPAAFTVPAPGTFGNLPRNALRGPDFHQFDLAFQKDFGLGESRNIEFRAEFFNIFNQTNFANPGSTLAAPAAVPTTSNSTNNPYNNPAAAVAIQPGQAFTQSIAGTAFGVLSSTVEKSVGLGTNRQIQFALKFNF